jgi:hypothetical protein
MTESNGRQPLWLPPFKTPPVEGINRSRDRIDGIRDAGVADSSAVTPTTNSAISFVDDLIRRLPFSVLVVQTDNGAEFQSNFHWHLEQQDVRHVYIRPKTPLLFSV